MLAILAKPQLTIPSLQGSQGDYSRQMLDPLSRKYDELA